MDIVPQNKQVQLTASVPQDNSIEVRQFLCFKKFLTEWPHVRISQDGAKFLGNSSLTGIDSKVLFVLLGNVEFENEIHLTQEEIAKELKTPRPEISKAIKRLIYMKLIAIIRKEGRKNIYFLNPYFAFKSRAKNHIKLTDIWDSFHQSEEIEA